jgi:chemotaxis protein MotB
MPRKSRQHEQEHLNETWLIPYADLLTLLLALFIVLFAASSIDTKKYEQLMISLNTALSGGTGVFNTSHIVPISQEVTTLGSALIENTTVVTDSRKLSKIQEQILKEQEELEELKRQIDEYITEKGLTTQLTTELNQYQLVLRISDNALYASGSAVVRPEARQLAAAIAEMLVHYPDYDVVIAGHTDNVPINTPEFPDNWVLSWKRAYNFMQLMLQNNKLDPERFSPIGFGEYRPVATNETEEGRAANRRVEISIIRTVISGPVEMLDVQRSS